MITAKKNAPYYLSFPAIDSTAPESYKSGLSPVDTAYYKDGAGAWTSLAITDTATEIGTTGIYEIDLTAAEMNHDRVVIKFAASGMADDAYQFDLQTKLTDDLNDFNAATDEVTTDAASRTASKADVSALATIAALTTVEGKVDLVLTDTAEIGPAGAGLTDVGRMSTSAANQIADHVIRRSWANVEASSDGDTVAFRSLLGAVAKLVNKVAISGTDLQIYRDDDTTVLGTQALTTDATAEPITSMDTT